jgi:hypothetical protein
MIRGRQNRGRHPVPNQRMQGDMPVCWLVDGQWNAAGVRLWEEGRGVSVWRWPSREQAKENRRMDGHEGRRTERKEMHRLRLMQQVRERLSGRERIDLHPKTHTNK